MPEAKVTIRFAVPLDHMPGDYAMLFSNNGSGNIAWDTPFDSEQLDLFPGGAGSYGFGMAPFGASPFGLPNGQDVKGFGQTPFGASPFGCGCVVIERTVSMTNCGDYKFALKCFDAAGNAHTGTPNEATVTVHVAPGKPEGLKLKSYNALTDVLVLEVVDPTSGTVRGTLPCRIVTLAGGPFDGFAGRISSPNGDDISWTDPGLPSRAA